MVNVPDLKPDTYTIVASINTRTELGVLWSKRSVRIGPSPLDVYDRLSERYTEALKSEDQRQIIAAHNALLLACFKPAIRIDKPCRLDQESQANDTFFAGADKVSAVIKWHPENEGLRVIADVTDVYLSTHAPASLPWNSSCLEIFVCASGLAKDICQFFIVPEGPEDSPRLRAVRTVTNPIDTSGIQARWKRTTTGYSVDALIPWEKISGYREGSRFVGVNAAIDSSTPGGRVQLVMNGRGQPWHDPHAFALLRIR